MSNLLQPPTYAPLTVQGPDGNQNAINPVWLQWFLQYAAQGNNNTPAGYASLPVQSYTNFASGYTWANNTPYRLWVQAVTNYSPDPITSYAFRRQGTVYQAENSISQVAVTGMMGPGDTLTVTLSNTGSAWSMDAISI